MSSELSAWWTSARESAFELVFADRINDEDIARQVGVCRKTLYLWRQNPVWASRMEEELAAYGQQLIDEAVREITQKFR